jgi:hypothetical protein
MASLGTLSVNNIAGMPPITEYGQLFENNGISCDNTSTASKRIPLIIVGFDLLIGAQEMFSLQMQTNFVMRLIDESYPKSLCHSPLRAGLVNKVYPPVFPRSGFAGFQMAFASASLAGSWPIG